MLHSLSASHSSSRRVRLLLLPTLPTVIILVLLLCVLTQVTTDFASKVSAVQVVDVSSTLAVPHLEASAMMPYEQPVQETLSVPLAANASHTPTFASQVLGDSKFTRGIAVGDLNGDGALDIIQGNYGQQSMVYLNDGHGGFDGGMPFGNSKNWMRWAAPGRLSPCHRWGSTASSVGLV